MAAAWKFVVGTEKELADGDDLSHDLGGPG